MQKVILLVEDNSDDELLTMRALARNHIANPVVVARDGVEALDYLLGTAEEPATGPLPALILLDLQLPKIDGFEVLRRIRATPRTGRPPRVGRPPSKQASDFRHSH